MSDFIEVLAPDTLTKLKAANAEIEKMIVNSAKVNSAALGAKSPAQADDAIKKLTAAYNEQEKTIQRLQKEIEKLGRARANNSRLTVQERLDNEILNRAAKEQAKFNSILTSEYEKLSITLNRLRNEAKSIAIVFGEDSIQFANAARKVQDLDDKLKRIDKTLGQSQRNVGNYIGGYNGLGNSINQIARELPAAAYGFQTFAIAIGNNIPIAIDHIKQATEANKALAEAGQKTVPVWTQVKNAIFSFNTALTVGLLVLALYGKEIGEFVKGLFNMSNAFDSVTKSQEAFNKARVEGQKAVVSDQLSLRSYLAIAKDDKLSMDERGIALKKLRSEYPLYFKTLTDQEILAGKTAKAEEAITKALNAKGEAEKANDQIILNKQRILELTSEEDKAEANIAKKRKERDDLRRRSLNALGNEERSALTSLSVSSDRELTSLINKRVIRQKEINQLLAENVKHEQDILRLQKESIGLQYSEDRGSDIEEYMRYIESLNRDAYELEKFRREQEILALEKLATDEKRSFADRLESYGEMLKKKQDLLKYSLDFEAKELADSRAKEVYDEQKTYEKNKEKYKNDREALVKIERDHKAQLDYINKTYESKRLLNVEKYNAEYLKIVEETSKAELEIIHKRQEAIDATEKTYRDEQQAMFKKTADNEKASLEIRQASFRAYIALKRKELDIEKNVAIAKAGNNEEEIKQIKARFEVANRLLNQEEKEQSPFAKELVAANAELEKLKKNITDTFLGDAGLGSLSKFFDGTFEKVMKGFDLITKDTQEWGKKMDVESERALKKFQYTFSTITDLAKTAFSTINELNQAQFQSQYDRLEKQRDIEIGFASSSADAREEIERQYEERRRAIARAEARQKKETAIFEAIIDTASAVVAALPNYVLAAAVGVLGAAQIALIASQPLPEYWKGTDNAPEGLAWTQEKGREIITDKHGNVKSLGSDKGAQLTKLSKGDKVFNASKTSELLAFNADFNRLMTSNNIITTNNVGKNTDVDYGKIGKEVGKALSKRPQLNISLDKDGFNMHLNSRNNKINYINNRVSGKADTV